MEGSNLTLRNRIRRVKCDEAKPFCLRCTKFGVTCDGYEPRKTKKETKPVSITHKRELAIKEQALPSVHLQPDLAFHLRVEPEDLQYFRLFKDQTTFELCGGFFDEPVWTRMVLQACHEAPCIQRIALSIAGLSRAKQANHFKDSKEPKDPHEEYALKQYVKSLREFRLFVASNGTPDPRMLLMAGLLIYCFECLQGNIDNGIQQIQSMISAFKDMRSTKQIDYRHLPGSHCNGSFEDELLTEIARLDGQLIGRVDQYDPNRATVVGISHGHLYDPFTIPSSFVDIRIARRFLEHMLHLSVPIANYNEKGERLTPSSDAPQITVEEDFIRMLRGRLAQWWISFKPHFDLACMPDGDNNFVAAVTLRVQALSASLILQTNQTMDTKQATEMWADAVLLTRRGPDMILSTCRELLDWARKVSAHRRFVKGFVFDNGIIPSLWLVLITGYKRQLTADIVKILRDIVPRREGYWDSVAILKTAEDMLAKRDKSGW
jgi:hypothetical protein